MSEKYNELPQVKELNHVQIIVDEEKASYASSSRKKEKRFAELLENLWREGEKAEAAVASNR